MVTNSELGAFAGSERLLDAVERDTPINGPRLRDALRTVDRKIFLDGYGVQDPYANRAYAIRKDPGDTTVSSSTQPSLSAHMIQALDPQPGDNVLEIGSGTGYNCALLSHVVGPSGRVTTLEYDPDLAGRVETSLSRAGVGNAQALAGDGWNGHEADAPYQKIMATMACWTISERWLDQLAPRGALVAPLWLGPDFEAIASLRRTDYGLEGTLTQPCSFNPGRGGAGGPRLLLRDPGPPPTWTYISPVLGADPARVELAKQLLSAAAHRESAERMAPSWYYRLALEEPGAFWMWRSGADGQVNAHGILEPDSGNAAWYEQNYRHDPTDPDRILSEPAQWAHVGTTTALERLKRYRDADGLDLHYLRLQIAPPDTALPHGTPPQWELHRPNNLTIRLWHQA